MFTKLKCIVADDEPSALALIKKYADDAPFIETVAACKNSNEVLAALAENDIDLLFLDIQMPGLSGMALAKMVDPKIAVIFTTAFDKYAIEGYQVNAIGYLLKPFSYEEFLEPAAKYQQKLKSSSPEVAELKDQDFIMVKADYKTWQIPLNDILYFEGVKDYVRIHRQSVSKVLMPLMSMKSLESQLPETKFMRVHRSYIVNLNKIEVIERNQIVFGDTRISVSDNYKEKFNTFVKGRFGA